MYLEQEEVESLHGVRVQSDKEHHLRVLSSSRSSRRWSGKSPKHHLVEVGLGDEQVDNAS
jgi:hypothetical protein